MRRTSYIKTDSESIKSMFNSIANEYDFMNNLMTLSIHKFIKREAVKLIKAGAEKILDVCTGTGDIARYASQMYMKSQIKAVDFSDKMLEIARKKVSGKNIEFLKANVLQLPYKEETFDSCIISFGLRNIHSADKALREFNRILKPGGQLIIVDLLRVENKIVYLILKKTVMFLTKIAAEDKEAYKYLINSISDFYSKSEILELLEENGFKIRRHFKYFSSVINTIESEKII